MDNQSSRPGDCGRYAADPMEESERRRRSLESHEKLRRKIASFGKIGWYEIVSEDDITRFCDVFHATFFPDNKLSTQRPSFTWDVTNATSLPADSPELRSVIDDLHNKCLIALQECCTRSKPWHAFENVHHTFYRVHFDQMPNDVSEWPIDILPYCDPCYLLSPDFDSGIIAQPRATITVFGDRLLSAIANNLPTVFDGVAPSGGIR